MAKYVKIKPSKLKGSLKIPSSKSLCHRAVISASLSKETSNLENIMFSDDIIATTEAMRRLGSKIEKVGEDGLKVKGSFPMSLNGEAIDCKESGSTLRFLIPISILSDTNVTFTGQGKLVSRPLDSYYKIFDKQGIKYKTNNKKLPLQIEGQLKSGEFEIKGDISSQFISGLLFSLPLLDGDSKINIIGELESKGYVDLTIDVLEEFGIEIVNKNYKEFIIKGCQKYKARDHKVEGDFSQAAFWLVGGILGQEIESRDLNPDSLQGDKAIVDLIREMNGDLSLDKDSFITKESSTKGIRVDVSEFPDIVPVLTVLAALSEGETKIVNAARLRIKESDRLKAISTELNKLGGDVKEVGDSLVIQGKKSLKGGEVDSWNDHRIAMALAIASIKCREEVTITNSDSVNKSYPHFWEDFKSLGGQIDEFDMG
ncbi:MAG: 3-phosphoshikimate 1-carboxyvinyltransferase [Tissierella sp.]|uniref:3-phosphoshikimate 1-carboxyvinyltransferase n=1 Tax=Tissierella sp. TaxID=41274 RepID=UPI003F97887B